MAARSDKTAAHISPLSSAPSGESSRGARRRWAITASGLIIVLAGAAVYHNSLNGPFIFDDINSIPGSPTIRSLWPIWPALSPQTAGGLAVQDRPIVNLSLAVNYAIGELDVRGYHIFNLVVHLLAALTLFGVIRRTLQLAVMPEHVVLSSLPLAFVAALIWTVHPLNTEAVTYIIQRTESLMALFYLLTLYCVIRAAAAPGPLPWYLAAVVACALGAGCKEAMVTAPVIILLYDRVFLSRSFKEVFARRWPLYVGLAATWGLLAALVLPLSGRAELLPEYEYWTATRSYAYMQFEAVVRYLGLCFWPYTLVMDYGELSVGEVALSVPQAIVIGLLLAGTIWGLCRRP
ncbi:MAG: glycosyltransferase family 39 protein, partial [Phycisphaerae bacterium]|nr:glycosyltransferase family 39 protein [Phycisphaerae bacterium]